MAKFYRLDCKFSCCCWSACSHCCCLMCGHRCGHCWSTCSHSRSMCGQCQSTYVHFWSAWGQAGQHVVIAGQHRLTAQHSLIGSLLVNMWLLVNTGSLFTIGSLLVNMWLLLVNTGSLLNIGPLLNDIKLQELLYDILPPTTAIIIYVCVCVCVCVWILHIVMFKNVLMWTLYVSCLLNWYVFISMYIMQVLFCLFSALSCGVGAQKFPLLLSLLGYTICLRFCWCSNGSKFVTDNSYDTRHSFYNLPTLLTQTQTKPKSFLSRWNQFFYPGWMHLISMCVLQHDAASAALSAPKPFDGCWQQR